MIPGLVRAVVTSGDCLYVAGDFASVGQVAARNVAAWDGQRWRALGTGMKQPGAVQCAVQGGDGRLVVAGHGGTGKQVGAALVFAWNGSAWEPVEGGAPFGSGLTIEAIAAAPKGELYVVADIAEANRVREELRRFDGAQWSRHPFAGRVRRLAVGPDGTLYGAGQFEGKTPDTPRGIGRWDGSRWQLLGTGLSHPEVDTAWEVTALAFWRGALIVGGTFRIAGPEKANFIAGWTGTNWFPLGSGLGGLGRHHVDGRRPLYWERTSPRNLVPGESDLVVFGEFAEAGGVGVYGAARWDGTRWSALAAEPPSGVSGGIAALATDGRSILAAGQFTAAGGVAASGLALWDGTAWRALPGEVPPGSYGRLAAGGGRVWIGTASPRPQERCLLEWDGRRLTALPPLKEMSYPVLASDGRTLVSSAWRTVQVWEGGQARSLESFPTSEGGMVSALAVGQGGDLYAAVPLSTPGCQILSHKSGVWSVLPSGPGGYSVAAMLVTPEGLYVGGHFERARTLPRTRAWGSTSGPPTDPYAGMVRLNNLGLWDGASWRALGSGLTSTAGQPAGVTALVHKDGVLYVGGRFTHAGGVPAWNIAAWNGRGWKALGEGVKGDRLSRGGEVHALAILGEHLYVGGWFIEAGGRPAMNFARWRLRRRKAFSRGRWPCRCSGETPL